LANVRLAKWAGELVIFGSFYFKLHSYEAYTKLRTLSFHNASSIRSIIIISIIIGGARSVVVEALCYKPEGRGIASRRGEFFSNLPKPSGRTIALGSTQPLTEMSTRNLKIRNLGVKDGRRVGLTTLPPSASRLSK
jgi:hypothetical protein